MNAPISHLLQLQIQQPHRTASDFTSAAQHENILFVCLKKAELTPESERGSSVYLVSTSFFLSTELGLHLPQRSSARSRSRLPATHRRRGGLKITPLTKYRFPAASADSGLILLSNRYNKRTLKKTVTASFALFVCLFPPCVFQEHRRASDCHKAEGTMGHRLPPCDWWEGREGRKARGKGGGQINLGG